MDWTYLTTVSDQLTAEMLTQRLQEEGIEAMIHPGDTDSYVGPVARPCRVVVAANRWRAAMDLLEAWGSQAPPPSSQEPDAIMEGEHTMKIYTRRGDTGETGLLYGGRVSKADPRTEAYGTIDEAVSALGLARSLSQDARVREIILGLQRELFTVGAELATDVDHYETFLKHFKPVTAEMTTRLETTIDSLQEEFTLPRAFVIPGASAASGAMDLARSILRRAERRAVSLHEEGLLKNDEVLRYLNRLADLLFILPRYEDRQLPPELLTGDAPQS